MADPAQRDANGGRRKRASERMQLAWTLIAIGVVMPIPVRNTAEGVRPGLLQDLTFTASWAFGACLILGILLALAERDREKHGKQGVGSKRVEPR